MHYAVPQLLNLRKSTKGVFCTFLTILNEKEISSHKHAFFLIKKQLADKVIVIGTRYNYNSICYTAALVEQEKRLLQIRVLVKTGTEL